MLVDEGAASVRPGVLSICRLEAATSRDDFQHLCDVEHGFLGEHPVGQALVLEQPHARGGLANVRRQVSAPLAFQGVGQIRLEPFPPRHSAEMAALCPLG